MTDSRANTLMLPTPSWYVPIHAFTFRDATLSKVDMFAPERQRSKLTRLGVLFLEEGPVNLMFKLVGKNEKSEGLGFDLIMIQCDRTE